MKEELTGKRRLRINRKGKLILQVQRNYMEADSAGGVVTVESYTGWRDAKIEDLDINLESLDVHSRR